MDAVDWIDADETQEEEQERASSMLTHLASTSSEDGRCRPRVGEDMRIEAVWHACDAVLHEESNILWAEGGHGELHSYVVEPSPGSSSSRRSESLGDVAKCTGIDLKHLRHQSAKRLAAQPLVGIILDGPRDTHPHCTTSSTELDIDAFLLDEFAPYSSLEGMKNTNDMGKVDNVTSAAVILSVLEREREHQEVIKRLEDDIAAKENELSKSAALREDTVQRLKRHREEMLTEYLAIVEEINAKHPEQGHTRGGIFPSFSWPLCCCSSSESQVAATSLSDVAFV